MDPIILSRIEKLLQRDPVLHGFRRGDVDELNALSSLLLKKTACRGCPEEQQLLYLELRTFVKNLLLTPQKTNAMSKFQLPGTAVLHDKATGRIFSNKNLNDEQIFELLHRNPRAIKAFSEYPEDWEKGADAAGKRLKAAKDKNDEKKGRSPEQIKEAEEQKLAEEKRLKEEQKAQKAADKKAASDAKSGDAKGSKGSKGKAIKVTPPSPDSDDDSQGE